MRCNAAFFGTKLMPEIELDEEVLLKLAEKSVGTGLTVAGVQKKLSLHLSSDGFSRLTLLDCPAGYILKPQTEEFAQLPEAEDLVMDIAEMMGVRTVPHGLIEAGGSFAYITKRVDRLNGEVYAMEDFCQLSGRLTEDKYRGSYEKCAGVVKKYSSRTGFDLSELFLRLVVCFVTGNSDMHLKNFSMIETAPGSREYVLSPAYDLLPVNVVMPEDTEETALTLNGKKSALRRSDFMKFAETIGINPKSAERMTDSVLEKEKDALALCDASFLNAELKAKMKSLVSERCGRLR